MKRGQQLTFNDYAWRVVLSSKHYEWATPQELFDRLDAEFGFALDAAATEQNAKCLRFFTKADDGLAQPWTGTVWCNPPYGRQIPLWVKKAYESAVAGATVVMLIPARTDTRYWHEYVMRAADVRFVRGRVKFGGAKAGAPFPSAVVVFGPGRPADPSPGGAGPTFTTLTP